MYECITLCRVAIPLIITLGMATHLAGIPARLGTCHHSDSVTNCCHAIGCSMSSSKAQACEHPSAFTGLHQLTDIPQTPSAHALWLSLSKLKQPLMLGQGDEICCCCSYNIFGPHDQEPVDLTVAAWLECIDELDR